MAPRTSVEVERKYDVDERTSLPPLAELPDVVRVAPAVEHHLEATYFDTENLALAAEGITLRRRTGGADAGWHLKLPQGPDRRDEIAEPLGAPDEAVPERLRQLTKAHVRDRPLVPVARLTTTRACIALHGADDAVLAEISDDQVDSESLVGGRLPLRWREWEIELLEGRDELLDAGEAALVAAGAHRSAEPSKLARALGDSYPQALPPERPRRKGPASDVVLTYIRVKTSALKAMDRGVREDEPDAVHQLRVSARSMRSALATYRKLLDRGIADHLREELKWAATEVGQARDIEVSRQRLLDLLAAEPPELLMGPVSERIEEELGAEYGKAREAGLAALDSGRYFRLLDGLDDFLAHPPFTDAAGRKAGKSAARLVRADLTRVRKAVRAARTADNENEIDAGLHEVRKCAKRLRYGAEAAAVVHGKRARRLAKQAAGIQQILGDLQDTVVSRELLRELAIRPSLEGTSTFSLGRLHAQEERRGAEDKEEFWRQWTGFKPKPLR